MSLSAMKSAKKKKIMIKQTKMIVLMISDKLNKYSYEKYATAENKKTMPII